MTNTQKLHTIIEYAIQKGFNPLGKKINSITVSTEQGVILIEPKRKRRTGTISVFEGVMYQEPYYNLLFKHEFAKAIFGEEPGYCNGCERHHDTFSDCDCGTGNTHPSWQFHLMQAVISEDVIDYYYQYVLSVTKNV